MKNPIIAYIQIQKLTNNIPEQYLGAWEFNYFSELENHRWVVYSY